MTIADHQSTSKVLKAPTLLISMKSPGWPPTISIICKNHRQKISLRRLAISEKDKTRKRLKS